MSPDLGRLILRQESFCSGLFMQLSNVTGVRPFISNAKILENLIPNVSSDGQQATETI